MPGIEYSEEYFEGHFRVIRIVAGSNAFYSIDVYRKINSDPSCEAGISVDDESICYVGIGRCTGVIVKTSAGVELVNLRLTLDLTKERLLDPREARELCIKEMEAWLGRL